MGHPGAGRAVRVERLAVGADDRGRMPQHREQILFAPSARHHHHRVPELADQIQCGVRAAQIGERTPGHPGPVDRDPADGDVRPPVGQVAPRDADPVADARVREPFPHRGLAAGLGPGGQ
jgi:hypothetical protein